MTPHWHARELPRGDLPLCDLRTLFRRSSARDPRAREAIIVRFLPLARRLARQYEGRGEPAEDLYQAASVGLIKAVDRYSPERGTSFAAYARPVIQGEIRRHFRDTTWRVHVPRAVKECAGRVAHADVELRPPLGSLSTTEAIAEHLGLEPGEVAEARRALQASRPGSLDATDVGHDEHGHPLRDVVGGLEPEYERAEVAVGIGHALRGLKPRDRKVLLLRLCYELTQDEIAGRIGVSQMHVSRILRRAGAALTAACGLALSA
jgi:RNA polymerase sigma-B factor